MSKKSKMGRPKLPRGEAKVPFPIRFSERELVAFERKAVAQGLTTRAWISAILTSAAK
jgi:predicted DNA binding CopG/RHH family protein